MNAEILCVGTELLLGETVNTNAAWLAGELAGLGIGCYYQSVVGDNPGRLKESLALAFSRADIVLTTGGLGPTYDDLTKETVAAYFGRPMEMHQESLQHIQEAFVRFGHPMSPNNEKQALMPQGAVVFANPCGTAPGLALEADGKVAVMMPGPPREMKAIFESGVRPYLRARSDHVLVSHNIHFFGIGESSLESELRAFMEASANPTVAPYAKTGEVMLRVMAGAPTREEAEALVQPVVDNLRHRYAQFVYGIDVGCLENALVEQLRSEKLTVATAEGFSGGVLARRLQQAPGAEKVFSGGVSAATFPPAFLPILGDTPEAEVEVCASAMARAVREISGADLGIAVSFPTVQGDVPSGPVGVAVDFAGLVNSRQLETSSRLARDPDYLRHTLASHALRLAQLTIPV